MTSTDKKKPVPISGLRRTIRIIILFFIICFFMLLVGLQDILIIPLLFLFGWIDFLITVIPQIQWNWNAITFSGFCAIAFVVGWHYLASWLRQSMRPDNPTWPWRWTIMTSFAVIIVFSAAISVIGLIHQVTWLATTKEPMTRSDFFHPSRFMHTLESETFSKTRDKDESLIIRGADMRQQIPHALARLREPNVRVLILSDEHDAITGAFIDLRGTRTAGRHPYLCYRWNPTKQTMDEVAVLPEHILEFIADAEKGLPFPHATDLK